MKALPEKMKSNGGLLSRIKYMIYDLLGGVSHVTMDDTEFVAASSEFLAKFMKLDFGSNKEIRVLGMPRNDALFDHNRMAKEKWIDGIKWKFVITYMPTHRAYGKGKASPIPFVDDIIVQKWMEENNIILLVKNHPNMQSKIFDNIKTDSIIDITKEGIDPQVCIYHSDVLITDYSSVWMDYLLLERPIIFYLYDNWEKEDAGLHYTIKEDKIGEIVFTEAELYKTIKMIFTDYNTYKPANSVIRKYHKYKNGGFCDMYFRAIVLDEP